MIVRSGVGLVHAEIVEREPRVRKMTDSDMPSLVVVTGPPAAGKTTIADALAARLGWPLIAKDPLKEVLADALGVRGRDASQELGVATFDVLFHVLAQLLGSGVSVIAEGNFGRAEPFAALPPARLLQVHADASPEAVRERLLAGRTRHPVHYDAQAADEIAARVAHGEWDPLALEGELLRVDMTSFPDVEALADRVAALVAR